MKSQAQLTLAPLLLFLVAGSALSSTVFSEDDLKTFKSLQVDEVSTTCGGVLTGESGEISYKVEGSQLSPGERCVWVIRPGGKISDFTLGLTQIGFQNGDVDHRLSIHGFLHDRMTPLEWIPAAVGMEEMKASPVIIVTLHYDDYVSSPGFHFRYFGHAGSEEVLMPSPLSTDTIVANTTFDLLAHPGNGNNYSNLELSTFLFRQTKESVYTVEETSVGLVVEGMEQATNCLVDYTDALFVYTYSKATGWAYNTTLCQASDNQKVTNDDMILVVFDTNASVNDKGFRLVHTSQIKTC